MTTNEVPTEKDDDKEIYVSGSEGIILPRDAVQSSVRIEIRPTPCNGRIVHYVEATGQHHAAMIVQTYADDAGETSDKVGLRIFEPGNNPLPGYDLVEFDPTGTTPGTWHWIEFVEPRTIFHPASE